MKELPSGRSDEVDRLLESLFQPPSFLDRLRGADPRRDCLKRLAAAREYRVVPELLPLFAAEGSLSQDTARAIAALVSEIGPAALGWMDERARRDSSSDWYPPDAWGKLSPAAVHRLARVAAAYPAAIGLLASHPNGFVREAAVEELGAFADGQEIPFLALRANDWVEVVASRAADLLARRLVPGNRDAVLVTLPFIVRMLGQHRQDHGRLSDALRAVLLADNGRELLARMSGFDAHVRRSVYELIGSEASAADSEVLRAALADADAGVRRRAMKRIPVTADPRALTILERMLSADPVPGVRREALSTLAERFPDRLSRLLPGALLDTAARVRELARFHASDLNAAIVLRDFYIESLNNTSVTQLAAAIGGVGEIGTPIDLDLLGPFLTASSPRVRRAAFRASAKLDAERGVALAIIALADAAPSVRAEAVRILKLNAHRVEFGLVATRLSGLDPGARGQVLSLLAEAPKWDAAAFLLEALGDPEPEVRKKASRLLDFWIADFNRSHTQPRAQQLERIRVLLDANESELSEETARMLRFSLKTLEDVVKTARDRD